MSLQLYDTLTRTIRPLRAEDGKRFRFYGCGPTVYGFTHIGNFRTFINLDVFYRVLQSAGMHPLYVRNLTDVDDRTIERSQKEGEPLSSFTKKWTGVFHEDCAKLNLLVPDIEPRASDHVPQQIAIVEKLIENAHAYRAADGSVYFKVSSFPRYGRLTRLDKRELQSQETTSGGALNLADHYDRESIADFALWKARKPEDGENYWPSPWGEGRPGWHVECSAMSMEYLGETFDLHGGGSDLCFPHHDNEIAQSEGATGKPFARHWMHGAMLRVESEKMSKSLGNIHTVNEILEMGFSPMALRLALLSGHYRQPLNFTHNSLKAATSALQKLDTALRPLLEIRDISEEDFSDLHSGEFSDWGLFGEAWEELCNDLNTPKCLGELFRILNRGDSGAIGSALPALSCLLFALGLKPFTEAQEAEAPVEIRELAEQRWRAKELRDYPSADALRDEIGKKGWKVLDRKDGFDLQRRLDFH